MPSVQGLYYYNVHQEPPFTNYLHYFEYFQFSDREKWWRDSLFSCFSATRNVFQSDLEILIYTLDLMLIDSKYFLGGYVESVFLNVKCI